jgi:hypothetical protein
MTALAVCLICVFVQVGLTFWAIVSMGLARLGDLKTGSVRLADIALDTSAYPDHTRKMQRNAHNQLETPPLFYAAIALGAATGAVNWVMAAASVVYVALRLVHRYVHVTTNHVPTRFKLFLASLVALGTIWIAFGFDLLMGA